MTPHFFFISDITNSSSFNFLLNFLEINECQKVFARTSLNDIKEKLELFYEKKNIYGSEEGIKSFQVYEALNQKSN